MCCRYLGVGGAWAYYIYYAFGKQLFADGDMPALPDMMEQVKVSHNNEFPIRLMWVGGCVGDSPLALCI